MLLFVNVEMPAYHEWKEQPQWDHNYNSSNNDNSKKNSKQNNANKKYNDITYHNWTEKQKTATALITNKEDRNNELLLPLCDFCWGSAKVWIKLDATATAAAAAVAAVVLSQRWHAPHQYPTIMINNGQTHSRNKKQRWTIQQQTNNEQYPIIVKLTNSNEQYSNQ